MSNGSRPRPVHLLTEQIHRKAVIYRLAIMEALTELNPRNCTACHRAERILLSVDQAHSDPPPVPAPRVEPDPVTDDAMDTLDVALAFGVDVSAVEKWLRSGKIPPAATYLDERGRRRFHLAEIDKLLR